jgi:predicted RNA-binding protein (virulence factor B family)
MLGDDQEMVLLPKRDVKEELNEGDLIEVFTFYNEDAELEATTQMPEIEVGQMICIKASNVNTMGAFVKIGTKRDILIPVKEQRVPIDTGQMVLMILRDDPMNRRLFGSTRISSSLLNKDLPYQRGDEVELMIAEQIEVGRRVVVNGKHFAALFEQEITQKLRFGEKVKGYVRQIDGKDLIVSMQKEGLALLDDAKIRIMEFLHNNNGYARLHDDTDPEEIKLRLRMSKKTFKKASGMLFKEGKVILTKLGIKINNTGEVPSEWKNTKLISEFPEENTKPSVPSNPDEKTPVKPRKEFVDKRNYKGRINEFDNRNSISSTPRQPRERIARESREEERPERKEAPVRHEREERPERKEAPVRQEREERPVVRENKPLPPSTETLPTEEPKKKGPVKVLRRRDDPPSGEQK